jgi:RNA:NAD 2'-phosphotransferase (TPT1/KptA family)
MFDDKDKALEIATKRRKRPIVIIISAKQMHSDKYSLKNKFIYSFKLSTNNVWLAEIIPPKYFSGIINGI